MPKFNLGKIILFAAVIILLIFLHYAKIIAPAEDFIIKATRPIFSVFYSVSSKIRIAYNERADMANIIEENKRLKEQINSLIVANMQFKLLEEENDVLRRQLNFFSGYDRKYVIGSVISRGGFDSSAPNHSLLINKGAQDGLRPGLIVLGGDGIVVGKVISVKDGLSEICLTVNPECRLAATVETDNNTSGVAQGDLGLTIKMNFIPQTKEIKIGDIVITSGLEQNIPRGLAIGTISEVKKENNELWQNAIIDPLIDFNDLTIVSVLISE